MFNYATGAGAWSGEVLEMVEGLRAEFLPGGDW